MGLAIDINTTVIGKTLSPAEATQRVNEGLRRVGFNFRGAMLTSDTIPVNTGALRASIGFSWSEARGEATVGTPLVYAIVMELGRRAGKRMPPDAPIRLWVRRKLAGAVASKAAEIRAKARKRTAGAAAARALDSITFALRRKIGRDGIKVPLVADNRGAMFNRTLRSARPSFGAWFRAGFEPARVA